MKYLFPIFTVFVWFVGCQETKTNEIEQKLQPWPSEPDLIVKQCQKTKQTSTICWVYAAGKLSKLGRDTEAIEICNTLKDTWQQECHFHVAEGIAKQNKYEKAFEHCQKSKQFYRNCMTHILSAYLKYNRLSRKEQSLRQKVGKWEHFDKELSLMQTNNSSNKFYLLMALAFKEEQHSHDICNRIKETKSRDKCLKNVDPQRSN